MEKSTVYTLLKRIINKGVAENNNSVVTALVMHDEQLSEHSQMLLSNTFNGSLSMFMTAFLKKETHTKEEAKELKRPIDSRTEKYDRSFPYCA